MLLSLLEKNQKEGDEKRASDLLQRKKRDSQISEAKRVSILSKMKDSITPREETSIMKIVRERQWEKDEDIQPLNGSIIKVKIKKNKLSLNITEETQNISGWDVQGDFNKSLYPTQY